MANEQTATELSAVIPERWRPRYIAAVYEPTDIVPRILNVTDDFGGVGDIAHIATSPVLTVNDTSSDGSLTVQTQTLTDVSVTVNKNKNVTAEVVGIARKQAFKVWEESFPGEAGNAVRQQMQADLLGLYSDITNAAGDGTGNLGEAELLSAITTMLNAKLPILKSPDEFTFVLYTGQFGPLKKENFLDYSRTGQAGGGAAEIELPRLWSVPVIFSSQVQASANVYQNLLFHKTAFAAAIQRNVETDMASRLASAKDSWIMTVKALYGVKTVLAARASLLKSK